MPPLSLIAFGHAQNLRRAHSDLVRRRCALGSGCDGLPVSRRRPGLGLSPERAFQERGPPTAEAPGALEPPPLRGSLRSDLRVAPEKKALRRGVEGTCEWRWLRSRPVVPARTEIRRFPLVANEALAAWGAAGDSVGGGRRRSLRMPPPRGVTAPAASPTRGRAPPAGRAAPPERRAPSAPPPRAPPRAGLPHAPAGSSRCRSRPPGE